MTFRFLMIFSIPDDIHSFGSDVFIVGGKFHRLVFGLEVVGNGELHKRHNDIHEGDPQVYIKHACTQAQIG